MEFVDTTKTKYSDRIKNDFENLKNEVIENASILDEFSADDMLEFYNKANIYSKKCLDADKYNKTYTLLSYINSKEDFFKKIITTTMISYLFRQCLEYNINITELTEVVKDDDFLEPVPNKYVNKKANYDKCLNKAKQNYIDKIKNREDEWADDAKYNSVYNSDDDSITLSYSDNQVIESNAAADYKQQCIVEHEYKTIYDKNKHEYIKNVYDIDYDLNDDEQIKEYYAFEFSDEDLNNIKEITDTEYAKLSTIEYTVNKDKKMEHIKELMKAQSKKEQHVIYRFLKNIFSFNPDRHIKQSYKYEDEADTYEEYKSKVLDRVENDIKKELNMDSKIIENIVPSDNLWYKFNNYYEMHYDLFRRFVNVLYKLDGEHDLMINIHGQFDIKEEVDKFVKLNISNFITSPVLINNNEWKMCAKYLPNRENGEVVGEESDVVNGLLQKYRDDSKIAEELTKSNIKRSKLENMYKYGKTNDNLKEYLANNPRGVNIGNINENQVSEEEYNEFENKINQLSKGINDDDFAIQFKIIKPDLETGTINETKHYQ